jgi:hypothetical protein
MKYFLIFLFVIITSCHKQQDEPYQPVILCSNLSSNVDTVKMYLQGKWRWVEDKHFQWGSQPGYVYNTPHTEKIIEIVKIKDSTIIFYKNYFISRKYKFRVAKEGDYLSGGNNSAVFVFIDEMNGNITNIVPIEACSQYFIFDPSSYSDISPISTYEKIN